MENRPLLSLQIRYRHLPRCDRPCPDVIVTCPDVTQSQTPESDPDPDEHDPDVTLTDRIRDDTPVWSGDGSLVGVEGPGRQGPGRVLARKNNPPSQSHPPSVSLLYI